jgi:hypothetical protein
MYTGPLYVHIVLSYQNFLRNSTIIKKEKNDNQVMYYNYKTIFKHVQVVTILFLEKNPKRQQPHPHKKKKKQNKIKSRKNRKNKQNN